MIKTKPIKYVKSLGCGNQEDNTLVCYIKDENGKNIDTYRDLHSVNIATKTLFIITSDIANFIFTFEDTVKCYLEISKDKKKLICE